MKLREQTVNTYGYVQKKIIAASSSETGGAMDNQACVVNSSFGHATAPDFNHYTLRCSDLFWSGAFTSIWYLYVV